MASAGTKLWRLHLPPALVPALVRGWPNRSHVRRSSWTSRARPRGRTRRCWEFFETSAQNLLAAEAATGVTYHVALSVVNAERLFPSGYFGAKTVQEGLIRASKIPYTIVRLTQFFEFVSGIAQSATEGQTVRSPSALMQPIAADGVAAILVGIALVESM